MAGRAARADFERAGQGELRPREESSSARVAPRPDRGRQLGDSHGAGGGNGDACLGHDPLERLETGAVANVVRQQPVALLHRALELPQQGPVAGVEAADEAVEEAPSVRSRARE